MLPPIVRALTVAVLGWQHSLQGRASASPSLVVQVVAGAVSRPVVLGATVGGARTRVRYHRVQDAERGQGEAALVRAQLEPEHTCQYGPDFEAVKIPLF